MHLCLPRQTGKRFSTPSLIAAAVACAAAVGTASAQPAGTATEIPVDATTSQPAAGGQRQAGTVSNVFFETSLREALSDMALQTGTPILVSPTVEGTITLELENVPLPRALDMVLAPGGYVWRRMDGYILVGPGTADSPLFSELSETRAVELSNIDAESALNMLPTSLRDFVTADITTNRLLVAAPPMTVERIMRDIQAVDTPAKHVLLEARVVVLERDALLDLGVDWDFPTIQTGTFSLDATEAGGFPWAVQVGVTPGFQFTDALRLSLNFLQQNNEASIVSSPQLTVRDGQLATMGVQTEEYFQIQNNEDIDLEIIPSGTTLSIQPRIGANNEVTLLIDVEVSDVVGRGDAGLPVVTRRTSTTDVQVVSGGTAAIAGLMETRENIDNRKVPGAGDIPLLGYAFRNQSGVKSQKQLAIFITATVIEDEARLKKGAEQMAPLPAVDEEAFRLDLVMALDRLEAQGAR